MAWLIFLQNTTKLFINSLSNVGRGHVYSQSPRNHPQRVGWGVRPAEEHDTRVRTVTVTLWIITNDCISISLHLWKGQWMPFSWTFLATNPRESAIRYEGMMVLNDAELVLGHFLKSVSWVPWYIDQSFHNMYRLVQLKLWYVWIFPPYGCPLAEADALPICQNRT